MAQVADLFLVDDQEQQLSQFELDFESETLDLDLDLDPPSPFFFDAADADADAGQTLTPLFQRPDYEDHLTLSLDLFSPSPPPPPPPPPQPLDLGFESHDEPDALRLVGLDYASDSDQDRDQDFMMPSGWAERRRDWDDDFEWEEVDRRLDEMDFLSMMVGESSRSSELEEGGEEVTNIDWEVLLAINNVVVDDEADYYNPSEYEVLSEHFTEAARGTPPAAKSVVETLPCVVLTKEDIDKGNAVCAVCKDEISLREEVRRLPCLHHYHGDCILPWLEMRCTCPVCRFELPTDDAEYERSRVHRRAATAGNDNSRYDLEMFSEGFAT